MFTKKINTTEAAAFLGVKRNTLEVWRSQKKGPKYSKIGSRVVYDLEDLQEYFISCAVHTRDTAPQLKNKS